VTTAALREDEAEQVAEVIGRVERPARPRHGY
jgi:hypothetical protein